MTIKLDYQALIPHLTADTLVITANARAQKAIFAARMTGLQEGRVEPGLSVQSMSQFIEGIWSELSFKIQLPKRISAFVLKVWLEKIIENEQAWTLTNPAGVASKVVEAYQNLIQWNLRLDRLEMGDSTEIDFFIQWMNQFESFALKRNLIADFAVLEFLLDKFEQLGSLLPDKILLVGFNQLTPLEQHFFEQLNEQGHLVKHYQPSTNPLQARQVIFDSLKEELEFAARYALSRQQEGKVVAIVVDQLANNLVEVHHQFSRVFQPNEELPWIKLGKPEYNVSAGFPLVQQSVVKAALTLLSFQSGGLKQQELHFLKNTPFIDWGEHAEPIRYFLHQLCLQPRKNYSFDFIQSSIEQNDSPNQLSNLKRRLQVTAELNQNKNHSEKLVEAIKQYLINWGWWFSAAEDDSFEAQAKQSLLAAINACRLLTDFYDKIKYREAIDFLKQQLNQQTFQVASDRANVHVLGVLEASGLQFDELLLIGFSRDTWPQKNKINPFLPLTLQREFSMPGSSAEREYKYASSLSKSLLNATSHLLVTSSRTEGEKKQNISQFFAHLPEVQASELVEESQSTEAVADYDWVSDDQIDLSAHTIKGGAYLLSDYAKCPFMAMAKYQVKIVGYQPVDVGIEPRSKGNWLHEAMELIWQSLQTQAALCEMDSLALEKLVEQALESALAKNKAYLLSITESEIVELEFKKLKSLIMEWLSIEKTRSWFEIASLESESSLTFDGLTLNFRVDRIDTTRDNKLEIIDYKTGATNTNNWFGVRPTEAQMPAYVLAMKDTPIQGLTYARVKTGEVAQSGLRFDVKEPEVKALELNAMGEKLSPEKQCKKVSFEQLKKHWQTTLQRLASGIVSGYSPVSPKDSNKTCMYCDYRAVCRITEEQPND